VYVTDGNLVLRTQYQPTMYGERQYLWTSGWLDSEHKFWQQFGRFEINAKLPSMCANSINGVNAPMNSFLSYDFLHCK
jgi:hypothetical protein